MPSSSFIRSRGQRSRCWRRPPPPGLRPRAGEPGSSGRSAPELDPELGDDPQTRSAIPSEAVRPVERIAATLTRPGQRSRGPDQVVDAAPGRAAVRRRPRPARRRRAAGSIARRLGQDLVARLRAAPTSRPCPRRRPRSAPRPPCRRGSGRRARPWCPRSGTGSRIRSSGSPAAGRRPGTRPCAGRRRSESSPASARHLVGAQPGAVDDEPGGDAVATRVGHGDAVRRSRCYAPRPESRCAARRRDARRRRQGEGEGDRVGDRLARDLERAVVAELRLDPVAARRSRPARAIASRSSTQPGASAPRSAAPAGRAPRAPGRAARPERRISSVSSSPGRRVEAGVEDPRVGAARRQPGLCLGLEQRHRDAPPRQRQRRRAADDAGADDRGLSVHRLPRTHIRLRSG